MDRIDISICMDYPRKTILLCMALWNGSFSSYKLIFKKLRIWPFQLTAFFSQVNFATLTWRMTAALTCVSSSSCLTSSSRAFSSRRSIFTSLSNSDRRCLHWSDEHSTDDLQPTQTRIQSVNQSDCFYGGLSGTATARTKDYSRTSIASNFFN